MSEKIIDTAEQTAEAAPKAAKKKPAALKKPADSGSFCVYLGPTMMGVIQRGTIYRGGRKEPAVCELSQAGQGHEVRRNFQ